MSSISSALIHRMADVRLSATDRRRFMPYVIRRRRWFLAAAVVSAAVLLSGVVGMLAASAAQPPVGLGTAASFAVLAGTTVTNTGPSTISGDLGVNPGSAITHFPPGKVINGKKYAADAVALKAQSDLTTAYLDAAGRTPSTTVSADLGGKTLPPRGVQGDLRAGYYRHGHTERTERPQRGVRLSGGIHTDHRFGQHGQADRRGRSLPRVLAGR